MNHWWWIWANLLHEIQSENFLNFFEKSTMIGVNGAEKNSQFLAGSADMKHGKPKIQKNQDCMDHIDKNILEYNQDCESEQ